MAPTSDRAREAAAPGRAAATMPLPGLNPPIAGTLAVATFTCGLGLACLEDELAARGLS